MAHAPGGFAAHSHAARSSLTTFRLNRAGTTAIEYALIAGSVSIVIVTAVTSIGQTLVGYFQALLAGF